MADDKIPRDLVASWTVDIGDQDTASKLVITLQFCLCFVNFVEQLCHMLTQVTAARCHALAATVLCCALQFTYGAIPPVTWVCIRLRTCLARMR